MADDMEKTEEPTSKKIEDARNDGNVPKSQDASSFLTLLVGLVSFLALYSFIQNRLTSSYSYYNSLIGQELTKSLALEVAIVSAREFAFLVLPIAGAVAVAGVLAALFQYGLIFTTKPITPDFSKMDPIKGLENLFSIKKAIESLKLVIKVGSVFSVAFYFLLTFLKELPEVIAFPFLQQLIWLKDKAIIIIAVMLILFLVLTVADIFIVRYQYFSQLKMSKQEIKDEYKQMEGDPQVKGRIRRMQMEMGRKRMMQEIPNADVVITNPTHYAVALRYNQEKEKAPRVVAKGIDHLAIKIKEIAREYDIQIIENPPLARELYKSVEIDKMIPENLFKAVAEVLAYVYKSSKKKR